MTAPVDVLAVMDRDAADADAHRSHLTVEPIDKADVPSSRRSESAEARAAVAELIEALRDCVDADQPMSQMHATERARAVLARVGGAK